MGRLVIDQCQAGTAVRAGQPVEIALALRTLSDSPGLSAERSTFISEHCQSSRIVAEWLNELGTQQVPTNLQPPHIGSS